MSVKLQTLEQIRRIGLDALYRELGLVGFVRFLQQYETGSGDYSSERHFQPEDEDVATLAAKVRQWRASQAEESTTG